MANKITDEELEELNKKLKESATPQINENSYIAMLKNLGEKEGYDYVSDYNVIKNSLLQQSYSPRANKVYTYEEAQTLTPQQYYDDVMAAADHTESGNKVTNALKTFVYGANEAIGGTALYKAIKGEEALQQKANQVERVYGNNQIARGAGNIVGNTLLYTVGGLSGGVPGAAVAGAISEGGRAYTYSNDPATIVGAAERGALFGLVRGGVANSMKNAIANAVPSAMGNVGTNFLINAASQGTGAYAGNAFAGTASNIINAASGKEVTAKEWSKPFWSIEALANAGLSALIGGAINTAIDRAQINQLMTKDLNTMNEQANANAIRVEQALRSGNKVSADIFAKAEIDNIDKFTNNTYAGMKFNNTFKEQMMNDWMNSMSKLYEKYGYKIDYTPTLGTGTSSYGVTPNYATPNTPTNVDTQNGVTYTSVGGATNEGISVGGTYNYEGNRAMVQSNGNENRLREGISGTEARNVYGGKSEEVVSQILQDDKNGYYEQSGNPELNKAFKDYIDEKIAKTTKELQNEPTIKIVDRKFTQDFIDRGYTNINGKTIENYEDLADISQIFRNPKYETFRVIYMQGNTIVGQEAVSSRLPNQTEIFPSNGRTNPTDIYNIGTYNITDRMKRLGADGYYLVHNHPSGDAYISLGDKNQTALLAEEIAGFKGHLVVNSGTYALMFPDASEKDGYKTLDNQKITNYAPDEIDKMMSKNPWFYESIDLDKLVNLSYSVKNNPNYSTVVITDADNVPRIIMDVKDTFFNGKATDINGWLKNIAKNNGGVYAYLSTSNSDIYNKLGTKRKGTGYGFNNVVLYEVDKSGNLVAKASLNNKKGTNTEITANLSKSTHPSSSYRVYENKNIERLETATNTLRNELAKKEDEVQATEMWSKRTERGKLNKKLDTAKNKLEQTKFEGKEKLKATKEEGKEKLKKLTSKKNEEKAQAAKDVKAKSNDNIRKLKAKNKEDIREAKTSARATTTDKKLRLSLNRLDKALNNVYDKPRSAETEKALDTVRKQTRGTIKLIDKVKTKLPSRYNFFTDDVLDIIDSYYTGGNTMTDEKRASLIKKSEAIEKFAKEHPEYPISKKALDLLKEPSKKNIADLNEKDLISLAEDLQEIGTAVRDMFSFTRASEDAVKLRNEAIDFAKQRLERGEGRNYNNLQSNKALNTIVELGENYVDKRSTIQTLTTALSGGDPNSPFNFIPKQLANGYDRYNRAMEKMLKLFDKYVDVKKKGPARYYDNKLNDIFDPKKTLDVGLKTTNGETYNPTIRDAISVVLGAKDPQFANHTIGVVTDKIKDGKPLLSEGGTAVFSNNIDERFGRIDKGLKRGVKVKLEASDIQKLEKALEDYPIVKDLMKTYKELTDLSFELTNESYEAINGMSLEKRDYYFPISNDPATRQRQNISDKLKGFNGQDASTTLLNTSIVKPVVEGANGQILIYPIDSVINKLIDNAALYNGYATALYDINTFLSAVSDDGEHLTELINHLDPSYLTNYGKITNALVGNTKPGGKMSSALGGNYTESILKANFWLALKQAGSYFTAAPFYNHATRSLMAGLFNRGKMAQIIKDYYKDQGIDISKLGNTETLKYFWDDKVNAELSTRTRGYTTLDKKRLLKHTGLLERIDAFDWFKSVDIATINSLAWAMFNDMLLDTNIEADSFMDDLGARYIDAMTATQPNTSVVTRAPIQVDGNIIDKALSYMADPRIKNANALATARMRYKHSKKFGDEEEQKKYGSAYGKIALGTLASLAYITLVSRTKQDAEGKKKETTFWQDMIGNVFGLTIGMEQIAGKFLNDYSFDVSLPDTQALNLIFNFGEDAMKIFSSDNPEKYIDKAIQDLSGFLGIPYKNLKNDYNALTNLFDKETFYKNKIKTDSNMYKKYQKFEDEIYNYREFYELYQATREKVVKENYGAYNNQNIKQAIEDYGADLETYYKMFKK